MSWKNRWWIDVSATSAQIKLCRQTMNILPLHDRQASIERYSRQAYCAKRLFRWHATIDSTNSRQWAELVTHRRSCQSQQILLDWFLLASTNNNLTVHCHIRGTTFHDNCQSKRSKNKTNTTSREKQQLILINAQTEYTWFMSDKQMMVNWWHTCWQQTVTAFGKSMQQADGNYSNTC